MASNASLAAMMGELKVFAEYHMGKFKCFTTCYASSVGSDVILQKKLLVVIATNFGLLESEI